LLNDVLSDRRRLSSSGRYVSALPTTTGHTTSYVVTDIERAAEEFRRHMIALCDQIVALLGERDNRNGIRFYFDFQSGLIGDVPQCFAKGNVVERHSDAGACRARCGRGGRRCTRTSAGRCACWG